MAKQYKIAFSFHSGNVTKESEVLVEAEQEPTKEQVLEQLRREYPQASGAEAINIISIAPYP